MHRSRSASRSRNERSLSFLASTAFWTVDDVEAEVAQLKAKGVVFEEYGMPGIKTVNSIATGGGARTAWFKDTEGNIMAISQAEPAAR